MNKKVTKKLDKIIDSNIDDKGNFIIDMMILDDESFISPFCGKAPVISSDVATYLDNAIKNVPPKFGVSLHITSDVVSKEKEEIHIESIRNYYRNEQKQLIRELVSNKLSAFIMFVIGLVVIATMIVLSLTNTSEIWITVLEIVGWVFVWEAVDTFFIERSKLKRDLLRANQFINAEVVFNRKK
ncbi:MAG: hypothetical protein J1F32_06150 [Erysipelotrichales bacterium]|nr:hypothetical protein [Erysipelotrichales bacterium]